jgi:predicted RNase H-like HicB family nuclease
MTAFAATVTLDPATGLHVGIVPGISGAHSQGKTPAELARNLDEVLALIGEANEARRLGPC